MHMKKKAFLAVSIAAILGATVWSQMPSGYAMNADSTRGYSKGTETMDSLPNDSVTHGKGLTASDQKNVKGDIYITTKIRREITARKGISNNAQNIKIVTSIGMVTLKGVVDSENEKETVGKIAIQVAGNANVTNELRVK